MTKFLAIYFIMGHYNADDSLPDLVGFDCPFDDSPVLCASDEEELEQKIKDIYNRGQLSNFERCYPDIISDTKGNIQVELYKKICHSDDFNPNAIWYSFGKETLTNLWEREKWRWVSD